MWPALLILLFIPLLAPGPDGVRFQFKKEWYGLEDCGRRGRQSYYPRLRQELRQMDTLCNRYDSAAGYVEIIRQDDPLYPRFGIALGFRWDMDRDTLPFMTDYAVVQFKDFRWGGVEFSPADTCNYTGVLDDVSDDLQVEILRFAGDTLEGRFSGLLLNAAGGMAPLDSGYFRVRLYRR